MGGSLLDRSVLVDEIYRSGFAALGWVALIAGVVNPAMLLLVFGMPFDATVGQVVTQQMVADAGPVVVAGVLLLRSAPLLGTELATGRAHPRRATRVLALAICGLCLWTAFVVIGLATVALAAWLGFRQSASLTMLRIGGNLEPWVLLEAGARSAAFGAVIGLFASWQPATADPIRAGGKAAIRGALACALVFAVSHADWGLG